MVSIQHQTTKSQCHGWLVGVSVFLLLVGGRAVAASEDPVQWTHDGLELVPDSEVAAVWVKPGADFSVYDRVMILEAAVAFRRNWQQDHNRTSVYRISNRDVERIKQEMAKLFREVFVEELSSADGYAVVDAADTDVLLLRPAIIDLDVPAPESSRAERSHNLGYSAGAATLYLELYDSVSGEILARAIDRQASNYPGPVMLFTHKGTNRTEARGILAGWAKLLRNRLDEVRGAPGEVE